MAHSRNSQSPRSTLIILGILSAGFLSSCGPSIYYVKPPDWRTAENRDSTIRAYRPYFEGWKIFLDPGHGGEDRRNHGPTGEIEADMNLRTSLHLRDYLRAAGATVYISRDKDSTVELSDRARLSNASGADIFISVHHNAIGSSQDPSTNFTSVWYHAVAGDSSYHECNHDIAKYIQRDLAYVMGNPGGLASFDGTWSDYAVYPNSGFAVLRGAAIPAVLIEGSFFSSEYEEKRLGRDEFNDIEAWGIFRGLGKYLKAGVPRIEPSADTLFADPSPAVKFSVKDLRGIDWKSLTVAIDGKPARSKTGRRLLEVTVRPRRPLTPGVHVLTASVKNVNGNSSFPYGLTFEVAPLVDSLALSVYPPVIPADGKSIAVIEANLFDGKGLPAVDGTIVRFTTSGGNMQPEARTLNGTAVAYLKSDELPAGTKEKVVDIRATAVQKVPSSSAAEVTTTAKVTFSMEAPPYVTGIIRDLSAGKPIADVTVAIGSGKVALFGLPEAVTSRADGRYVFAGNLPPESEMTFAKDGFFGVRAKVRLEHGTTIHDVSLESVADSVLFGKTFLLDPRYGGTERGDVEGELSAADLNLAVGRALEHLLRAAGADVYLLRNVDTTIPEAQRTAFSRRFRRGFCLRIDASLGTRSASCSIYPSIPNERVARSILTELSRFVGLDTTGVVPKHGQFYYDVSIGTISIELPSPAGGWYEPFEYRVSHCAWGIFLGLLKSAGYRPPDVLPGGMLMSEDGKPAPQVPVLMNMSLTVVPDTSGSVVLPLLPRSMRLSPASISEAAKSERLFFQTFDGQRLRFEAEVK